MSIIEKIISQSTEIVTVKFEQKETLANLMQFYLYDSSEYNDDEVDSSGKMDLGEYFDAYWLEPERYPFFIKHADKLVGFALIRQLNQDQHSVAEFFVMKKYRRLGIGKRAAFLLFDMFQSEWHIAQEHNNLAAQTFWKSIVKEYTNNNFQETFSNSQPKGPKQIFRSNAVY